VTGTNPVPLFRFPFGDTNARIVAITNRRGRAWRGRDVYDVFIAVLSAGRRMAGSAGVRW
jgi:hypothetical protein